MTHRYMKSQLDKIVENDYSIAYFHHGLSSKVRRMCHVL